MFIVDAEDPFVPCFPQHLFFRANNSNLEIFIEKLNQIIYNKYVKLKGKTKSKKIKIGYCLKTCVEILKEFGGRIITFCTTDIDIPSNKNKKKEENDEYEHNNWMYLENVGSQNEKELYSTKVLKCLILSLNFL
jgi:hypothetical protein